MTTRSVLSSSAFLASMMMSSLAQSDNLGIYAGIGLWNTEASGLISEGTDQLDLQDTLAFDDDSGVQAYIAIEHPIPILPNIRLQHTEIELIGSNDLTESFEFDGFEFDVDAQVDSTLNLTHTDATAYWQLWDTVVGIDIGVTARQFDGEILIVSEAEVGGNTEEQRAEEDLDFVIPLLYSRVGVKFPLTGLTADVRANFISIDNDALTDVVARINYEMSFGLGIEAGYRIIDLDIEENDFTADAEISGVFAGISYHF